MKYLGKSSDSSVSYTSSSPFARTNGICVKKILKKSSFSPVPLQNIRVDGDTRAETGKRWNGAARRAGGMRRRLLPLRRSGRRLGAYRATRNRVCSDGESDRGALYRNNRTDASARACAIINGETQRRRAVHRRRATTCVHVCYGSSSRVV